MEISHEKVVSFFKNSFSYNYHQPLYSMTLKLWDLYINIESPSLVSIQTLRKHYINFIDSTADSKPDAVIRFVREKDFLNFPVSTDYQKYTQMDRSLLVAPFFVIHFVAQSNYIEMVVEEGYDIYLLSAMRAIAPFLAFKRGGILLHASGVCYGDRLYAFVGHSGAGKSTIVKLLTNCEESIEVLTDEAVMLEVNADQCVGWGTPYGREHSGVNLSVPLGCCFFLVQDKGTYLKPLTSGQAVTELMANLWCTYSSDKLVENALDIVVKISEIIPCYELHFELNDYFWKEIRQLSN